MRGETYIRVYDEVITSAMCQRWITAFHESPFVGSGTAHYTNRDRSFKKCDELFVREVLSRENDPQRQAAWKTIDRELFESVNPYLVKYITELKYLKGTEYVDEGFRFKRYPAGEGHFDLHYDANPKMPKRVFSLILYLCDVEEGGETEFPEQEFKVKPKAGRLMVCPPFWTHPHRGCVPISNDKYIVNSFASFR